MINNDRVEVSTSSEGVELLRAIWSQLQFHPNADIDFYLTIVNSRKEILRPYVITIYTNDQPEMMLIGRIEQVNLDFKIGYKTIYRPKLTLLTIIYGGILGKQTSANCAVIISEFEKLLKNREIDAVLLSNISIDTPLFQSAKGNAAFLFRDHIFIENIHWIASLPPTIDGFLKRMNSKHRYWLRRIESRLAKDFPGQVKILHMSCVEHVEQLCNDVEAIAKHTYQRSLGVGFIGNEEHKRRLYLAAQKGWLRASLLYIGSTPCAYWIGSYYKRTVHTDFTGYNPQYKKYEIGTILILKFIEELYLSTDAEVLDFGFGDALYKQRFGDSTYRETSMYVFAPTIKGAKLNIIRTIINVTTKSAEYMLKKTNLIQRLKKYFRQQSLTKKAIK